ncbi:MAG: hypothetical protein DCC55_31410, partial [Chloroflexi bacterium]
GQEEYFYGPLGEVVKEIKTVASDTGPQPEVYTTEYLYDTWGRLQSLTYPDGEVLTYHYDAGGHIHEISGQKGGVLYPYVKRIEYDKFEERAFMEVANGVRTVFTYDPLDRRLTNLVAGKSGASPFQNLSYTYDNVGNVLSVANQVAVPKAGDFGGPTVQSYTYDDLYRLTGATGLYENSPKRINRYHLTMAYDSIHNIVAKQQVHEIVQPSGSIIEQQKTTYDWSYLYEGAQPHAVTKIGARNFTHDANGNQLGWTHDQNGTRRTIVWDEENRVQSIFDNGHEIRYKYNHQGERVIKRGPQGESVYVNQYFTIRNRELGAKHVYAGTERVVSKLVKQNATEKDQYFYHADHLGGTNYVTDADGKVYEHLEYFPFGETWVQEATDTKRTPYLFTGKELDSETGLYYYGARYYDPQTSRFISTDPLLQQKPDRGVGDPQFYNLYHYSNNNPLHYVDVDGRDVIVVVGSDVRGRYQRLFAATADLFINTVQQANPGLRVHRINVADLQLQQRADGNMETRVQALERRIGEVSRDVRGANNRVSTLVYIGHGTNEGNFLPYLERGEVGDPLSLREASELAQVENQGAVISEACFVGNDISAADQRSLRGRDLRIHATGAEVKFGQDGRVALSPDGRVPPRRSFVNPAEHAIPQLWQPIQLGADPLAQPPPPPTNAQVIRDAEQRTRRP